MIGAALRLRMWAHQLVHWRPLAQLAGRPDEAQTTVLRELLSNNADTRFGREHGFADIRDHKTFVARVPVQTYDTLRPYVEEQRLTGAAALTTGKNPLRLHSRRSGLSTSVLTAHYIGWICNWSEQASIILAIRPLPVHPRARGATV